MSSFKLQSGGSAKQQALSAGIFLIVIGLVVTVLLDEIVGGVMLLLGAVLALGSMGASE